jgi:hypothetical protein
MSKPTIVNVADLIDPDDPQGRTYRQANAARAHSLPSGTLVEIEGGARLFIVHRGKDCDRTPLYWLAAEPDEERHEGKWHGGYPEDSLTASARRP